MAKMIVNGQEVTLNLEEDTFSGRVYLTVETPSGGLFTCLGFKPEGFVTSYVHGSGGMFKGDKQGRLKLYAVK